MISYRCCVFIFSTGPGAKKIGGDGAGLGADRDHVVHVIGGDLGLAPTPDLGQGHIHHTTGHPEVPAVDMTDTASCLIPRGISICHI